MRHTPLPKLLIAAAFLGASWAFLAAPAPAAATLKGLQAGMEGPELSVRDAAGKQQKFTDLKGGKLTVLVFWSTWSRKSESALARMQKLHNAYGQKGLAIVGINADGMSVEPETIDKMQALQQKLKLDYPLLLDQGLSTFHDYGVIALPTTVILDHDRVIRYELSGFPLVGSEEMVDFITTSMEGKKPAVAAKAGYHPKKEAIRYYNMGNAGLRSRRSADATEMWFRKAAEADDKFVLPHLALGKMYRDRGDNAKAHTEYKAALDREPANPIALCESAILLIEEGNTAEGSQLLDTARKTEESYAPCYSYAGYALGKQGKMDESLAMFAEAEKINPLDYSAFVYRGRLFEEKKNFKEAAEDYRKALALILSE